MSENHIEPHVPHPSHEAPHQSFWLWVMCLTGVDYFSTLGYQPSIAFENTGLLAPLATVVLVVVTLFGALPVYMYVAGQSPHGQGSIAMLERLVHGWKGKLLVLVLLGFAATDFVITKPLSAADAAEHLISNPFWPIRADKKVEANFKELSGDHGKYALEKATRVQAETDRQRMIVTMFLLVVLGATFLRGFREVIGMAVVIVGIYLVLNAIVIISGLVHLAEHRDKWDAWLRHLQMGQDHWHLKEGSPLPKSGWWGAHPGWSIGVLCLLFFPKLALGLSGFETGVAVMPLIQGRPNDDPVQPRGRIRNTRKLLAVAALIMSLYLLGSALVVSTLIDPKELVEPLFGDVDVKPSAKDRALAYLAHGEGDNINPYLFGNVFGTIYDLSTVVILWFAGASAMAGLLNLVPQYLPRYGMAPGWAGAVRPLVILFTLVNLLVTWIFSASVSAQGGAYATGVLVLMSSACVATVIGRWRVRKGHWILRTPWGYGMIACVFIYTTAAIVIEKPDGIKIATFFIVATILTSIVSRAWRSTELRFTKFRFVDEQSKFLWESMGLLEFPVLVPHRPGHRGLASKEEIIRKEHRLAPDVPIVFLEVGLGDTSDFYQEPVVEVTQDEGRFILRIAKAASIPHVIAAVGLELSKVGAPPEIHFGWSNESPLAANLSFLLFGEGNVPWMVRELICKAEPNNERRPRIVIG